MNPVRPARSGASVARPLGLAIPAVTFAKLGPALAQIGLPFVLTVYLGMRAGGYDEVVRGEVGLAVWWVVLIGAVVGALPVARISRASWLAIGLLGSFAIWTTLGIGWSETAERSVTEAARVATLLGILVLLVSIQGKGSLARMAWGLGAGIAVIAGVALLSRLHPAWFPALEVPDEVPGAQARLHYPLQYWNGLAALIAMGMPILLTLGAGARNLAVRSVTLATLPLLALASFFTLSRGGVLEMGVALAVLLALHPARKALIAAALAPAIGSAILIAAADQRDDLTQGLTTQPGIDQGNEMIFMCLVVATGVGLVSAAVGLSARYGVGPRLAAPRPPKRVVLGVAAIAMVGLALVLPGVVSNGWDNFKESEVPSSEAGRFDSSSGSGRYQWWSSAVDANATDPLIGIGPGAFEYWWAREGNISGFIRDAHSLYMETLAELGIVGLVLILGVIGAPFAIGIRGLGRADPERRALIAGCLAACSAFAVTAGLEWAWELTILPVAFMILLAGLAAREEPAPARKANDRRLLPRIAFAAVAIAGLVAVALPLAGANAIRNSQADVRGQDLNGALEEARTAVNIQPYAAAASLQEALVLELLGDFDAAVASAREATDKEPTNWRNWLILSRIEDKAGNSVGSVQAYNRARELNPRSAIFQ